MRRDRGFGRAGIRPGPPARRLRQTGSPVAESRVADVAIARRVRARFEGALRSYRGDFVTITLEPASTPGFQLLANTSIGFRLAFPDDWQLHGQVVATEFAEGAGCQSVETIDHQPSEGSTALILHSFVQICARPLEDTLTLDQFMLQTYGNLPGERFEPVELSGQPAYRSRKEGADATIFVQTENYRIQIVSAVAADPEVFSIRTAQVQAILESFTFAG